MHAGVMKLVGEAVHQYTEDFSATCAVTTIGIAPWGCVLDKEILVSKFLLQNIIITSWIRF